MDEQHLQKKECGTSIDLKIVPKKTIFAMIFQMLIAEKAMGAWWNW